MANAKETSKKVAEKVSQNNEEILVKVKSTLEDSFENIKKTMGFDNAPDFVKETVNAQEALAKNWFDSLIRVAKVSSAEELNEIFNAQMKQVQKNFTTAFDVDYWKKDGKDLKASDYMTTDYAKFTVLKAIDLCQPAK
ncbi:MAG: hypothetical protein ACFB0B_12490 [Thermonemataceae bacterium]